MTTLLVQPRTSTVLDLTQVDAAMLPLVGGKAANLGEMIRAGLPVPGGFCVTTEAYQQIATSVRLDFESLEGRQARQAFEETPIPPEIADAIVEAYEELGDDVPVAVRSSATAEDLPNASFAGQQDTYLHIIGADAVLDAVRRCWASLWTDRAIVYRTTNGIDHRAVQLAVVVQRMVDAEVAGVLFTANPVTGRRHEAVIDASPGLGEAVVSGAVNPDHFVVDTASGEIIERRLGDKRVEVRSLPGGGTEHVVRPDSANRACVSEGEVRALATLGQRVETHYGAPQDTEWAIDAKGALWLTQARPITTLFPLPANTSPELQVYLCFSVAQGLYRPITPMGLAGFRLLASSAAKMLGIRVDNPFDGPPAYAEAGQRLFINLTNVLRGRVGRAIMPRLLGVMEARSAAIVHQLLEDPRLSINRRSPALFLSRVLRIALRNGVPWRVVEAVLAPASALKRIQRLSDELDRELTMRPNAKTHHRLAYVERALGRILPMMPKVLPVAGAGFGLLGLAGKLLGKDAQPGDLQTILRSLPHNVTTEMDLELWDLAGVIKTDQTATRLFLEKPVESLTRRYRLGILPTVAQEGLNAFLSKYGHRAIAEIDLGMPRWADDPSHILGVLANYLRLDNADVAPSTLFAHGVTAAEAMIETLTDRARRRGRLRGWAVRFALRRARELAGIRELPKYLLVKTLAAVRAELAMIGADLVRRGVLETAEDIFMLDLGEVRAAAYGDDQRLVVRERQQSYAAELRRKHVPNILLSDGTEPEAKAAVDSNTDGLMGTAASAGRITGIARVILDPVGARLEPGEILVAPSTDPGWTPLFLTAGGLVMEMGGANSHGAVVAREYGIPAVVGVPNATARITTGQRITVDGAAGTITLA